MREVEEALREVASRIGMRSSEDLLPRYVEDPEGTVAKMARRRLTRRWRPVALAAAAVVAVLAVGATAVALLGGRGPGRPRVAAPADSALTALAAPETAAASVATPEPAPAAAPATATALAAADSARARLAQAPASATALAAPPAAAGSTLAGVTAPAPGATLAAPEAPAQATAGDSIAVEVTVAPPADIFVDGRRVASAATRWSGRAARRTVTVRVDAGEYGTREQKKKPRARDAALSFQMDLLAGSGGVYVSGPRDGLDIYVDGVYRRAVTPSPVRPLSVGPHTIEVRVRGTGEVVATRQVVVREGPSNVVVDFSAGR
jgi:hypothetical protein